jgi:hypothetical protein
MTFSTIKVAGKVAIRELTDRRSRYPMNGEYPFLIGGPDDLERLQESTEFNELSFEDIIRNSQTVDIGKWIEERRRNSAEDGIDLDEMIGDWQGEVSDKGSIALHIDILSKRIKPEVYIGIASIQQPWHLPAVLKYGGWNDCPDAVVQCAFHRAWQSKFAAMITGMSSDVIECLVARPPRDQKSAMQLAWEQYCYCADIVEQGCGSVSALAGTLLNSPYWFFWWD